jgi:chromosome segregation protein
MVLSEVEIAGFKSFARKTKIPFRSGVTAVVGPNGCGKTNVVDAIRWVLGEQKTGVLRSDRMENVIFNGTKSRKPLGLAEVTINLQNTNGLLPIPQSEIRVTRRLFRNGQSEYLLNQNVCRLKDIVELFQDTGVGPDSYSIIELKMVEDMLSDDPVERRHLFEEAAGVSKYKHRRKMTARKLDNVHEDLERLGDILREVETQVSHLRRQMQRAVRYQKMKDEWRKGQIALSRRNSRELLSRLESHRKRLNELSGETVRHDGHITGSEALLEKLKAENIKMESELKSVAGQLSKLESNLIRTEETLKYLKERRAALDENRNRWEREKLLLDEKKLRLRENQEALEGKLLKARDNHQACREKLRDAQDLLAEARQDRTNARAHLEKTAADRDLRREKLAEMSQQRSRMEANIESIDESVSTNTLRMAQLETQIKESHDQTTKFTAQLVKLERELDKSAVALDAMKAKHEDQRKSLETARWDLSECNHRIESIGTQLQWLQSAIGEGSSQQEAVQWLVTQNIPGIVGTLGDLVEAPDSWQSMIAAVLGEESHWIVCDTRATAIDAISRLRHVRKGQLTFLPLDGISAKVSKKDSARRIDGHGVIGSIADGLTNEEPIRSLLNRRLGNVVGVAGDPDNVLIERATSQGITIVTTRGDVYWPAGMLRGGRASEDKSVAIGRMAKIKNLQLQLASEEKRRQEISTQISKYEHDFTAIGRLLETQKGQIEKLRNRIGEVKIALNRISAVKEQYETQRKNLQQDIDDLTAQKKDLIEKLSKSDVERDDDEKAIKVLERQARNAAEELKKAEQRLEILTTEENKASMGFVEAANQLENLQNEAARVKQQLQDLNESMVNREEEVRRSAQEIEEIDSRRLEAERGLVDRFRERDKLWSSRDDLQEKIEESRQKIKQEESRLRQARQVHETTAEEKHRIEIEITRIESEIRQMQERLRDFDIPIQMIEAVTDPEDGAMPSEEDLAGLRRKIESMEPVNLLAIEEFETVNQRYEFLKTQRDDLIESKEMLEDTIRKINEVAQQKFFETFQVVRRNFQEIFRQLFGEGDADLLLSGQDLLESDISIWANPSGKKLKTLALMSGGEKALTSIALLFAIYRVKPSPFCVLDEVDAPLDDANVNRFLRMIRDFSENTQFIVVTHNKRTMEFADQLHGITMEEEGVSKLVTVRLESIT